MSDGEEARDWNLTDLHHVGLTVSDIERSVQFYEGMLGMTLLRRAGTLVVVGMPPSGVKAAIEVVDLADNAHRILGSKMGSSSATSRRMR